MSYKKTDKFFEFNRQRREQGRTSIACVWPDCTGHAMARELPPTKLQQYPRYRIDSGRGAGIVRYPICDMHINKIREVLGEKVKLNGIKAIIKDASEAFASRSLGYPMARLVLWDRAKGCCQKCEKPLAFNAKREWEIDHIVPLSIGGMTAYSNLQILCIECHEEKSRPERGIANTKRSNSMKSLRWHSHHQKDALIANLHQEIARLKTIIAGYASEEEMAG